MSNRIIDERIVKMEFDNQKFEQNAQASLRTIDKLKAALKFENADKGFSKLEDSANKINLARLESNIQRISDRFSAMGIVGDQVLRNITNSVMQAFGKINKLMTAPINQMITGGKSRALNIRNAQFSLSGLGIDWKQESEDFKISVEHMTEEEKYALKESGKFVDSLYKDIDYAVSGTAYGLDAAAKAAASLAASNVNVGDDMRMALRGISGVAAMTNTSYEEISRIFTHVAGKNKLQTEELNMISERGLNATAKLAEYLGKSEVEIKELVGKGKIDFMTFAEAMDSAFGEHAKAANDTFEGSLSNMKAALSRIGADFAGPIYDNVVTPFNSVRKIIDNVRVALQPVVKNFEQLSEGLGKTATALLKLTGLVTDTKLTIDQMPVLAQTIKNVEQSIFQLLIAIFRVIGPIRKAFVDVFKPSTSIFLALTGAIRKFTAGLIMNSDSQETLYNIAVSIFKILRAGTKIIGTVTKIFVKLVKALRPVINIVANLISYIADLISGFLELEEVNSTIDIFFTAFANGIANIVGFIVYLISNIANIIVVLIDWIRQFNIINPLIEKFGKLISFISGIGNKVYSGLDSFFGLFKKNKQSVEDATVVTEEYVEVLGERFGPAMEGQQKVIEDTDKTLNEHKTIFEKVIDGIVKALDFVKGKLADFYKGTKPLGASWIDKFKTFNLKIVVDALADLADKLSGLDFSLENIVKIITDGYNSLMDKMGMSDAKVDWNKVLKIGNLLVLFGLTKEALTITNKTTTVISGLGKSFDKIASGINSYLTAEAFLKRISAFKTVAQALVMLAASLFIIAAIPENRLWESLAVFGIIAAVCAGLVILFKYLDRKILPVTDGGLSTTEKIIANLKKIASAIAISVTAFGLGTSILLIVASFGLLAFVFEKWSKVLSDTTIDVEKVKEQLADFGVMILELLTAMATISFISPATGLSFIGFSIAIGSIVVALYALLGAIYLYNKINWEDFKQGIEGVIGAIGILTGAASALLIIGKGGQLGFIGLALIGLAVGVYAIANAIKMLQGVDFLGGVGAFIAVTLILAELVGAIMILNGSIDRIGQARALNILALAFVVMSLAYATMEMVKAIEKLTKLNHSNPVASCVAFIEILLTLGAIAGVMYVVGAKQPKAAPILSLAIIIGAIAYAIAFIAVYDWEDIGKSLLSIVSVMAIMSLLANYAAKIDPSAQLIMFGMASTILATGIALAVVATQPWDKIAKSAALLLATIFFLAKIMSTVRGINGDPLTILAFSGAIVAIGILTAVIAKIDDPVKFLKTAIGMSMLIGAMAAVLYGMSKWGSIAQMQNKKKLILTMLIIVGALAALIVVMTKVSNADDVLKASAALTLVIAAITGMYAALSKIRTNRLNNTVSSARAFRQTAIAVGILAIVAAAIVVALSKFTNAEKLDKKIAAFSVVMIAIAGLYVVLAKIRSVGAISPTTLSAFRQTAIAVGVLAAEALGITVALSHFTNSDGLLEKIAAFDLIMVALAGLYATIALIPTSSANLESKVGLLLMITFIAAIGTALTAAISQIPNPEKTRENIINLGLVLAGLIALTVIFGALCVVANAFSAVITAGVEGIVTILAYIIIITVVIVAIGGLINEIEKATNTVGGTEASITKFFDILSSIFGGIGDCIGNLIGSAVGKFLKKSSEGFVPYCEAITKSLEALKPIFEYLSSLDSDAEYVKTGVEAIKTLFSAFTMLQFNDLDQTMLEQKIDIITGLVTKFDEALNGHEFDTEAINGAIHAGESLKTLAGVLKEYIAASKGLNETDGEDSSDDSVGTMGQKLVDFAKSLIKFNNAVSGITFDDSKLESAKKVAEGAIELANSIAPYEESSGFVSTKKETLGQFGENLETFVIGLAKFMLTLSKVEWDQSKVDDATETANKLITMQKTLSEFDLDSTKFTNFSTDLETFAGHLGAFMDEVSGHEWDQGKVDDVATITSKLAELSPSLGEGSGILDIFTGGKLNFKTFGDNLVSYAKSLSSFDDVIGELETSKIESICDLTKDHLIETLEKLSTDSIDYIKVCDNSVAISSFGNNVGQFANHVSNIDTGKVTSVIMACKRLTELLETISTGTYSSDNAKNFKKALGELGKTSFDKFIEAFSGSEVPGKIKGALDSMLSNIQKVDISSHLNNIYKMGQSIVAKLIDGVGSEESLEKIRSGMTSVINGIKEALKTTDDTTNEGDMLHTTGSDMLRNIADGFDDEEAVNYITDKLYNTLKSSITNAILQMAAVDSNDFKTAAQSFIGYFANAIYSAENVSTVATQIQRVADEAVQDISVSVGVNVDVNESGVLGDSYAPVVEDTTQRTVKAIETSAETINKASTTSANSIEENNKKLTGDVQEDLKNLAKNDIDSIVKNAKANTEAAKKEVKEQNAKNTDDIFADIRNSVKDGVGKVGGTISNGAKDLYETVTGKEWTGIDVGKELEKSLGMDGLEDIGKNIEDQINNANETFADGMSGIGDTMSNGLKGAGGAAGKAGDEFVAVHNQFWDNLFAAQVAGMQGFEQQFADFDTWQKEKLEKTKTIVENYNNAITDAKKQAAEGLFSEVAEPKEDVTKEKLKQNLQDQVNQLKEFNGIILNLRTRLMGTNLFDAITEMGVDSIDELRALNSMTDEELSSYAQLYDEKFLNSFTGIKEKAQLEMQNLYGGVAVDIDQFARVFDESTASIEKYFTDAYASGKLGQLGSNFSQGVAEGLTDDSAKQAISKGAESLVQTEINKVAEAQNSHSPAEDERVRELGSNFTQGLALGLLDKEAIDALQKAARNVISKIIECFNNVNKDYDGGSPGVAIGKTITESIVTVFEEMEPQVKSMKATGSNLVEALTTGFNSQTGLVKSKVNTLMESISTGIDSQRSIMIAKMRVLMRDLMNGITAAGENGADSPTIALFKKSGTTLMNALLKGIELGWSNPENPEAGGKNTIDNVMKKIIELLKEYTGGKGAKTGGSETFFYIGQQFIKGLIKGLKDQQNFLYDAVKAIVEKAIETAKDTAVVESPSKRTTEIGMYIGMGLVNGLKSMSTAVESASSDLTEEAFQGFRDIATILGGMDDFDGTPTIAPVMDLTGIQNGVYAMNDLLDSNRAYEMATSISNGMDARKTAKINEMASLRRAMDTLHSSNSIRTDELTSLQAAVNNLQTSINSQTSPDYVSLQNAINGLNSSIGNVQTGNTLNVNPTFNITSNDPKAVAEEVNDALQKMINRRSAVWA